MKKLLVALLLGTALTVTACADGGTDTTTAGGAATTAGGAATTTAGETPGETTTSAGAATTTADGTTSAGETGDAQTVEVTTTGMYEGLVVRVTATPDTIQNVEIVEHSETEGISDPAIENMPAKIVEENSYDVDVESGATMTSEAIKEAVQEALTEMGYDLSNFE